MGFSIEEQLLRAILPSDIQAILTAAGKELDERQKDLKARQKDRETSLASEMARKVIDNSLEEHEPQFEEQEEVLKELRAIIADLKQKLSENVTAKDRIKEKHAAIEVQKKECRRWKTLHEFIGSAYAKKYRDFAQQLTSEMMVGHANRQLQNMPDRYLLPRDDPQLLELNLNANYQAGWIRSTKNLFSGESFIVSLSLALGLSLILSKNVRVESLFLNKGFATLDEEALDTAVDNERGWRELHKVM